MPGTLDGYHGRGNPMVALRTLSPFLETLRRLVRGMDHTKDHELQRCALDVHSDRVAGDMLPGHEVAWAHL